MIATRPAGIASIARQIARLLVPAALAATLAAPMAAAAAPAATPAHEILGAAPGRIGNNFCPIRNMVLYSNVVAHGPATWLRSYVQGPQYGIRCISEVFSGVNLATRWPASGTRQGLRESSPQFYYALRYALSQFVPMIDGYPGVPSGPYLTPHQESRMQAAGINPVGFLQWLIDSRQGPWVPGVPIPACQPGNVVAPVPLSMDDPCNDGMKSLAVNAAGYSSVFPAAVARATGTIAGAIGNLQESGVTNPTVIAQALEACKCQFTNLPIWKQHLPVGPGLGAEMQKINALYQRTPHTPPALIVAAFQSHGIPVPAFLQAQLVHHTALGNSGLVFPNQPAKTFKAVAKTSTTMPAPKTGTKATTAPKARAGEAYAPLPLPPAPDPLVD